MLTKDQAIAIVRNYIPEGEITLSILYKNLFVFQIFYERPFEEQMDPFFSVNRETGEFRDFSILTDGDQKTLAALFTQEQSRRENDKRNRSR